MIFFICSIDGSHFPSNVVFIVLTLIPAFNAQSLYAGHAGSITIISSPGFNNVLIAEKIENLAPGLTKIFSCVILTSNFFETNSANASLNIGIPFACPYFMNPFSKTSESDFSTIFGGKKSGSPTSICIIFSPFCSSDFAFKKIERCVCLFADCTFIDSFNKKFKNFDASVSFNPISFDTCIILPRKLSSRSSSVTPFPIFFLTSPISFAISVLVFSNLIISNVTKSILFLRLLMSDIFL